MSKRVLVTGSAGFIGGNFVRYALKHTDWDIVGLDRLDEAATLINYVPIFQNYPHRFRAVWHDLRAKINPLVHDNLRFSFDYIVHMAAASHVDRSIKDPLGFIQDNVVGTAHLFEFARDQPKSVSKILYFSTDEVFGPALQGDRFNEYSRHEPNNPYAASKAGGEALVPAWANTYGLPICVSHCTNVYGPGQYGEKFIPLVAKKVVAGELVQIHAKDGLSSSRYYVHVDDVSRAVLTILNKGGIWGGPGTGKYNISGAQEYTNLDVAQRIAALLGHPLKHELVNYVPNRPRHDMAYRVDSTTLEALGWKPEVSLDDGLKRLLCP